MCHTEHFCDKLKPRTIYRTAKPRVIRFNCKQMAGGSSRNNQHYALICTTSLFYILALTCFGSSLPSLGSFLDPSELLEIQIEWMVYHIMCGYVTCVSEWDTPAYST
jgi:hypothetical protein